MGLLNKSATCCNSLSAPMLNILFIALYDIRDLYITYCIGVGYSTFRYYTKYYMDISRCTL
uniref:Uncharacterized protein n=1 Tax=Nelumbo nucifera TaxID=4432 RepID=A0A822XL49_NELNU|nr:TPA_asm: hypothetical protein HUJ06_022562 [Nelumbo nucifera]